MTTEKENWELDLPELLPLVTQAESLLKTKLCRDSKVYVVTAQ